MSHDAETTPDTDLRAGRIARRARAGRGCGGRRPRRAEPLPRADRPRRRQGHRLRRRRRRDRVPGLRDPAGLLGNVVLTRLGLRDRLAGGVPHRVLHQDRPGAARRVDQPRGDRQRRRAGDPPGAGADQRRVPVHLVARRPARARRQAARPAASAVSICGVSAAIAAAGRGAGQAGAAGVHGQPGDRLRAAVDLPAARGSPTCWGSPGRGRGLDRRQHRHHRGGDRGRRARGRAGAADRDHRQDDPERAASASSPSR